ncbi:MAG: hypothetical protein CV087_05585 [Candidatus Brocadia sp. WS118]|nr:MAG: hypothetical protein CV087_05585 [Candidatus Brocadia sp. WS118]
MERIRNLFSRVEATVSQEIEGYKKEIEMLVKLKTQLNDASKSIIYIHEPTSKLRYRIDSLFLMDTFKCLVSAPEEALRMVTGIAVENNLFVLDRLIQVDYQASITSAKADFKDLFAKLIELEEKYGHFLLAVFHSHPFNGITGTSPSGIDRNLQENLESSKYKTIQAIFSRDGYVRFFSNKLNFEIETYGKGVEKIYAKEYETIFKLGEIKR